MLNHYLEGVAIALGCAVALAVLHQDSHIASGISAAAPAAVSPASPFPPPAPASANGLAVFEDDALRKLIKDMALHD